MLLDDEQPLIKPVPLMFAGEMVVAIAIVSGHCDPIIYHAIVPIDAVKKHESQLTERRART